MTAFTIRVELHRASWENYVALANKLRAQGVVDVIKGDNGVWYKLPPAEYTYEGDETIETVRQAVAHIASQVVPSFAVLITEARQRAWQGLQVVREAFAA